MEAVAAEDLVLHRAAAARVPVVAPGNLSERQNVRYWN